MGKERWEGVLLYVREGIEAVRELNDLNYPSETVWVKFKDSLKSDIYRIMLQKPYGKSFRN